MKYYGGNVKLKLQTITEHYKIPDDKDEIPTPETAHRSR